MSRLAENTRLGWIDPMATPLKTNKDYGFLARCEPEEADHWVFSVEELENMGIRVKVEEEEE